jgi:hypothetical protein
MNQARNSLNHAEEFHSVRWFYEAPLSRSDSHLGRFLEKLALTSCPTTTRATMRAPG